MAIVNALFQRAIIILVCSIALNGIWQPAPDFFARGTATLLLALVIASCVFTRVSVEPKRIPVVERKPEPPGLYNAICPACDAPFGDLGRGVECTLPYHHDNSVWLLGRLRNK